MNKYIVIMAGGAGLRLWPLSREKRPKQFVSPDGKECMLIKTLRRALNAVPPQNCFIVTNQNLFEVTKKTVRDLMPEQNIILEPSRKNTAACIAYAAFVLAGKLKEGIISFLPADGHVEDKAGYSKALEHNFEAASATGGLVITGVVPSYPATGFGYIQAGKSEGGYFSKVKRFVEKPDEDTAKRMLGTGEYLWNSGIVTARMDVLIDSIKQYLPLHYGELSEAMKYISAKEFKNHIERAYNEIPEISFDNGVLERSENVFVVRGGFDWNDIGSLDSLAQTLDKDEGGQRC